MSSSFKKGVGVVTAPQPSAAYEASEVLRAGGNAADAAVAGALVQGVVDPHRCGMGGFGCATTWFQNKKGPQALSIDFHGRLGSKTKEDQWVDSFEKEADDGFGYILRGKVNDVGYQAITIPGMVAGLHEIHNRYGSLPWKDLVTRAVPYARDGFIVDPEMAAFWRRPGLFGRVSTRDRLTLTEAGKGICLNADGELFAAGDRFCQPQLATTLKRLASEGAEGFYRGEIGKQIVNDFVKNGSFITEEDLASYVPEVSAPLEGNFCGKKVLSTPLPGGGVALLQVLHLIEKEKLSQYDHNSAEYLHCLAAILQAVWHDRVEHHSDPLFSAVTAEKLLKPDYITGLLSVTPEPVTTGSESPDTTQLSIIDGWGNAVSFSHSLGYNSGVFHPTLGILFNNCSSAFDPRPGKRSSLAPGKARSTAIAETIVLENDRPWLVLGSPGASRITAGLAQVLANVIEFKMNLAEAVVQPRIDAYGPGTLLMGLRFPEAIQEQLGARGWDVLTRPMPYGLVGRVYACEADGAPPKNTVAGVDPGAPGVAYRIGGG